MYDPDPHPRRNDEPDSGIEEGRDLYPIFDTIRLHNLQVADLKAEMMAKLTSQCLDAGLTQFLRVDLVAIRGAMTRNQD
jgi:hypothetical protein